MSLIGYLLLKTSGAPVFFTVCVHLNNAYIASLGMNFANNVVLLQRKYLIPLCHPLTISIR